MFQTAPRLLLVAVLFALAIGCDGGLGSKSQAGKVEVYYKKGITKAEADRMAQYLVKSWGDNPSSVQLQKSPDGYIFRMVVKKEFQTDPAKLKLLAFDAARISRDVFDGMPVELQACDEYMKTVATVESRPDLRYGLVDGKVELFYASPADKDDAQRLAAHIAKTLPPESILISFKLAKRGKTNEVHMVVDPSLLNNPGMIANWRTLRRQIGDNVFPGTPTELHLCDPQFNDLQTLTP